MRLSAQEVYEKLVREDKITTLEGKIAFFLGDVNIIVKQKDVVGNIMQEWLQGWLDKKGIAYATNDNTQMPPDFFLNPEDRTKNLLEVKAFNRDAGPGFDIADFRMYAEEIIDKPYMLDVDYLIFGYRMDEDGIVTIRDVWLKKVWEITRRMEEWPINLQIKDNVVHKIRPGVWYSQNMAGIDYSIFESLEDFISALEEAVYKNPKTHNEAANWKSAFLKSYKQETGIELRIPRWDDIKDKYDLKTARKRNKAIADGQKEKEREELSLQRLIKLRASLEQAEQSGKPEKIAKIIEDIRKEEEKLKKIQEKISKCEAEALKYQ